MLLCPKKALCFQIECPKNMINHPGSGQRTPEKAKKGKKKEGLGLKTFLHSGKK